MDLIKWQKTDSESSRSSGFNDLREANQLFDVTLCCDNGIDVIRGHKVILAANSSLFRRILTHSDGHQSVFLYLKGVHREELEVILDFMYRGQVDVERRVFERVLVASIELEVQGYESLTANEEEPTAGNSCVSGSPPAIKQPRIERAERKLRKKPKRKIDVGDRSDQMGVEDLMEVFLQEAQDYRNNTKNSSGPKDESILDDFVEEEAANLSTEALDNSSFIDNGLMSGSKAPKVEARFLRSQKGSALLVDSEGYTYHRNRSIDDLAYWVCKHAKAYNCRGTLVTKGFHITKMNVKHQHEPKLPPSMNDFTEANENIDETYYSM